MSGRGSQETERVVFCFVMCFFFFFSLRQRRSAHPLSVHEGSSHERGEEHPQPMYFSRSIECNYTEQ